MELFCYAALLVISEISAVLPIRFEGLKDVVKNHSILLYHSDSKGVPCIYCTDEFYSNREYFKKECHNKYDDYNNITYTDDGNIKVYHRLCVPFREAAKYKKDVQCPLPFIQNGTTQLFELYHTFDDRPPAHIIDPIVGIQLKIYCDQGYITDNSISECGVQNQKPAWNPMLLCRRIGCFGIPDPENGVSNCKESIVDNGTICNVTCNPGYSSNKKHSQCLEGNFSEYLTCNLIVTDTKNNGGLIGGIIGGVILIIALCIIVVCLWKHKSWVKWMKKKKRVQNGNQNQNPDVAYSNGTTTFVNGSTLREHDSSHHNHDPVTNTVPPSSIDVPPSSIISHEPSPLSIESESTKTSYLSLSLSSNVQIPSNELDEGSPLLTCENDNKAVQSIDHKVDSKTPVENEYIIEDHHDADEAKEGVENEDFTNFKTLDSTGSDLIGLAAATELGEETNPKGYLESDNTCPKVFNEIQEASHDKSKESLPITLPSHPSLSDFGAKRTETDAPVFTEYTVITEIGNTQSDAAYGSAEPTLSSNPEPLLKEDGVMDEDTGRGTMEEIRDDSIPEH